MKQRVTPGGTIDAATPDELIRILDELRQIDTQVVLIDTDSPNAQRQEVDHFPVPSHARAIVPRRPSGGLITVDTNGEVLAPANRGRLGGQLVNTGTNPVFVYLGTSNDPGIGVSWLAPNGGTWDFEISDLLWVGAVFAVASTGTSPVAVIDL